LDVQKEKTASAADRLRQLLKNPEIILMAACYDAISAKLVEAAGFDEF
jgi:2-methylisocitrate lyase-like PEP mutase family enzyme